MSQNPKPTQGKPGQSPLFDMPPADVQPKEREKVAQLVAAGKTGFAVDFAKDVHKRRHSAASEALLLDAYGARIASLLNRRLDQEAQALMDLVRERYPSAVDRLREWTAALAARNGDIDGLLEPLNDPSLPPEKHAAISALVRRDATDLHALAECRVLAPEHPLRTAAAALHKALEAVTSGPVADEALALPEVSRHSPLAPWKMLIRAIGAFYRRDDALCEKFLAVVEADSAAARLTPALRGLIGQKQPLTPAATQLVNLAGGNLETLRTSLNRLDEALGRRNQTQIVQEIHNAVAACQAEPGLLVRLKQHISLRAMMAGAKVDKVVAAMAGASLKNAYFWRLLARATEDDKTNPLFPIEACSFWEEFRRHAVHEGLFPDKGPEVATLYLHMADVLHHLSPQELQRIRYGYESRFNGHAAYYQGQPPEIRALLSDRRGKNLYFLSLHSLLERACMADPCADNFQRWLRSESEGSAGAPDVVAERWCEALPNDIPPLLHLMESAEKRNALQKAFKLMEQAERIDALNPEVRRARLRLLVSMAARHLRQKKARLAEPELRQLEALPQVRQGDRPAFVAALRWVWCHLRDAPQEATAFYQDAVRQLGDAPTVQLLFLEVERWCGQSSKVGPAPKPTVPLFAALGRVCALGEDMGMRVAIPAKFPDQLMKELTAKNVSGNLGALAALGEAAMRQGHFPLAYTIAGAGLAQGAEGQARFLFLRARALPPWDRERRSMCLSAASELARRQRDHGLLNLIGQWRDEVIDALGFAPDAEAATMSTEEIDRVVQRELREQAFPTSQPYQEVDDDDECQCPECRAKRMEMPQELQDMVEQFGPEVVAKAMAELFGIGGKRKRKRRTYSAGHDFPF